MNIFKNSSRTAGFRPLPPLHLWVVAVALLMRIWILIDVQDAPFWQTPSVDENNFVELAEKLNAHDRLPFGAFYVAPGYAYLLAAILGIGGNVVWAKVLQLAVGVLNAWLICLLGRRYFARRAGLVAGLLWAVYPAALLHEVLLLKPTLTVCFTLLTLLALARPDGTRLRHWLLAGLALGLASLFRGEMIAVALTIAGGGIVARRHGWPGAGPVLGPILLAVIMTAVVAVPTIQNLRGCRDLVIVAYGGGTNFYIGNHDGADGSYLPLRPDRSDTMFEERDAVALAQQTKGRHLGPAGVSRFWFNRGLQWWGREPITAIALTLKKSALVWGGWEGNDVLSLPIAGQWVLPLRNPVVRPLILLPPALVAIWLTRRRRELWPLWSFLLASHVALSFFFIFERFRLPLTAVSLIFTGWLLVTAFDTWRDGRRVEVAKGAALAIVAVALLAWPQVSRDETILRVNVGNMLLRQERYTEAIAEYQIVRRESPAAGRVNINIAGAMLGLGRRREAVDYLRTALAFLEAEARRTGRPSVEELLYCHEMAGATELEMGRREQATRHFEAALRLAPDHPRLQARLRELRGEE